MKIAWIIYSASKTTWSPLAGRHPFSRYTQIQSSHLKTAFTELLDNLREVASIDDLPFQHGTPLATERENGSGETVLADYDSDLESFSPERLVPVII